MLAAIYCRLSKEDVGREHGTNSESIVNQRKLLTDYAIKSDFEIYDYYIDEDRSGLDRERPEFLRLIEDAKLGNFSVVLCKTQSRFTRDMELVEKYIHGLFPLWGIRFISVVETYDTAVKGNKKARQISGLVNEWYCEDLSENIKAVLHKKMQDGEFIGSFACYGYKKAVDNKHELEIEEETAQVVRDIFGMYLEGYGIAQIADLLRLRQVLTPTAWKQSKGLLYINPSAKQSGECYKWSTSTIKKILANEAYTGTLIQGREQKISYKDKKMRSVPKKDWICVPNHHEAIINKEVFEQVRQLRSSRCRRK
ncbi:MAG: recombinase family protein [Lachnospiraceae bacterium]|nr:recombinase family protein [Lachnospiraceae bacterium]